LGFVFVNGLQLLLSRDGITLGPGMHRL